MSASAIFLACLVVGVSDGDTIKALCPEHQLVTVRLSGIDSPEKAQPFGQRSKQHLSDLVFGKEVDLSCPKIDRYRRYVCRITAGGQDVNLEQIRDGMAWHYKAYAREQPKAEAKLYAGEEEKARARGVGL